MQGAKRSTVITAAIVAASASVVTACGGDGEISQSCTDVPTVDDRPLRLAATVAPITDIVEQLVAGTDTTVDGVVPPGRDSHTFEPTPAVARSVSDADVLIANGLDLEVPTIDLALANMGDGTAICELGGEVLPESEYRYDRSFPESAGSPNPHVWLSPPLVGDMADVLVDLLVAADPDDAETYRANLDDFSSVVDELDDWVRARSDELPVAERVLLTYHDAYAYFADEYGWEVVGAVQPSSFDEPSPSEVADLIEQVRAAGVTAVFGSEVYPSPVLEQIAREAGAVYVADLRDDVLPGEPGDPEHSWQGLVRLNVDTIVAALQTT